jgi:EAL domain-containing protein (putative c-di-GMP-specific phosphodiesterase class I)
LDIDILKLDKQFVDKLSTEEDKDLAQIIISMAHHIDKQVVAEGVETSSQHDKLCHLGCDYLQGFHLSKPLEDLQALAVLMNHEKERTLDISQ